MRKDLRFAMELAFIYALPITSEAKSNSRLETLQLRLQKVAGKKLSPMIRTMRTDYALMLESKMNQWGVDTGWRYKKKNIGSIVCWLAQMIDDSPCKFDREIILLLGDIIDHIDSGGIFYPLSVYSGQVASDKWQKLMTEGGP